MNSHASAIEATALRVIYEWQPPAAPHCSNCLHCVVNGVWPEPKARCEMGHGPENRPQIRLIALQRKAGHGFAQAAKCPDYCSMDDEVVPA